MAMWNDRNQAYPIIIVDIRTDLVLLEFERRCLRADLTVRRHEPVPRGLTLAVDMGHIPFQGADIWQLQG